MVRPNDPRRGASHLSNPVLALAVLLCVALVLAGCKKKDGNANAGNIAHFNMDAEYRSNQELAASGETFQHREVKAIAPGKHSLQQLVNNVKSQTDALEDKWAEGRRNRGEGGSKYGF